MGHLIIGFWEIKSPLGANSEGVSFFDKELFKFTN